MLIKNTICCTLPVFIVFIFSCSLAAETIHLKSGGKVEGAIISEKNGTVIIDVGFGTTTVDTADIASIQRSNRNKKGNKGTSTSIPRILKPVWESLHRLRSLRFKALNRKRDLEMLNHEIDSLEKVLENIEGDYVILSEDLRKARESEVYVWREQNYLVNKAHGYNTQIIACRQQLNRKSAQKRGGNPALNSYLDSLARVTQKVNQIKKSYPAKKLQKLQPRFDEIEKDISQFNAEFEIAAVDVTFIGHNHILVPVKINGRKPVKLILDTGASSVVLSRSLATRLGINWSRGKEIVVTLANGEKAKGNMVTLRTVSVNRFRADRVRATVMEKAPAPGIGGLLGMSYLDRFMVRIDAVNKKLVLNNFRGR